MHYTHNYSYLLFKFIYFIFIHVSWYFQSDSVQYFLDNLDRIARVVILLIIYN